MTDNERRLWHEQNTAEPPQKIERAAEALPHETRIQIDDGVQPLASDFSSDFYSIRNARGSVHQNISSIFNQARSELERRTEQTMWRLNLNNVFEGVRQSAQYNDNFRFWAPQFPPNTPNNFLRRENLIRPDLGDTVRLNLNTTTPNNSLHQVINAGNQENIAAENNESRLLSRPERPILDRVTTEPDLIERSVQRANANDHGAMFEVLSQEPDAQRFLLALTRYIPFICILLIKSFYDHFGAVFDIICLFGLFHHVNDAVKQNQRRKLILLRDAVGILLILPQKTNSYYNLLLFRPITQEVSLGYLLHSVLVTDSSLKVITVLIKIMITMLPASVISYKRRGRFYMLIESISQLYRAVAPIQLWLVFLLDSYWENTYGKILGASLSMVYMVSKYLNID